MPSARPLKGMIPHLSAFPTLCNLIPVRLRPLHLAMLIFQTVWLIAIVPGHQRGIILLPGSTANSPGCCEAANRKIGSPAKRSPADSSPDRSRQCAICHFSAHLNTPPTLDHSFGRHELQHRLESLSAERFIACPLLLPFDSRGPPAIA